jgi:glycerol uptake facilitator-like aquaporin
VGTTLFLLIALGATNVANVPTTSVTGATTSGEQGSTAAAVNTSSLLYIALAFGFSLAVNAWIFFRVSGGLFNPAVSWGMVLVGALTPLRGALLTVSQILGGITGKSCFPHVDARSPSPRCGHRRRDYSWYPQCANHFGWGNQHRPRAVH